MKKLERFLMCAILSAAMAALVVAPRAIAQRGGGQGGGRGGRGGPGGGAGGGGGTYGALRMRNIGPSMVSGRIVSIAVDPTNKRHYFIARGFGRSLADDEWRHDVHSGF